MTLSERVDVAAEELDELHLRPEVDEVDRQAGEHDETQYEHVFRRPGHAGLLNGDGIALRAAGAVVVEGEDQRIEDVDQDAGGEHGRTGQRIPVGAEELADRVVTRGRDDGGEIHGHVEEDEEHQEASRDAHHQFLAHGRIAKKTAHNR